MKIIILRSEYYTMNIFEAFYNNYLHKKSVRLFGEANVARGQGDFEAALDKLMSSLKMLEKAGITLPQKNELMANSLSAIAQVRGKLNQFELAEKDITKALGLSPNNADLYWTLGSLKLDQRQFQAGIPLFEKVIELNPLDTDGYFFRGVCSMELKLYPDAIPYFESALELEPEASEIYFHLGFIYDELKQYEKAIGFYDKAIAVNNDYYQAFVNRGNCKIALGKKLEACEDFHQALELGDITAQENIDEYCK